MSDQLINKLILTLTGTSHSEVIKLTVRGLPKGLIIDRALIDEKLTLRRGEESISTPRREPDEYYLKGGIIDDLTNGAPLTIIIKNKEYDDTPYAHPEIVRPGHADLVQYLKYDGNVDLRGGGICSGRMTVPFVILGAICETYLRQKGIKIASLIKQIGPVKSNASINEAIGNLDQLNSTFPALSHKDEMIKTIKEAKKSKDSLGGITETLCLGLPLGLGEAFFGKINSNLAKLILLIPGATGISFGEGFNATNLKGSEYNDVPYFENDTLKFKTNHSGGLSGGMTNGNPLIFTTSFRPASSIGLEQATVNLKKQQNTTITINGMHDSCFVPRALHVVNALTSIAIFEAMLNANLTDDLESLRTKLDLLDEHLINLLNERFMITEKIGYYKNQNNLPTLNKNREALLLNKSKDSVYHEHIKTIYETILKESKDQQAKYMLVAGNTMYSYSKMIHNLLGNNEYVMHQIASLGAYLENNAPLGLNVTNPLKKEAYYLCTSHDEWAKRTEVVNLMIKDGDHYQGFNTDVVALDNMLKHYAIDLKNKNVLILGNGSSSQTVKALAEAKGAKSIKLLVRHIKGANEILFSDATKDELCDIIINTTTFGVYPNLECGSIIDFNNYPNVEALINLNYNPNVDGLLQSAASVGIRAINGLYMLSENARLSENIWHQKEIDESKTIEIMAKILKATTNVVIVGQSLAGKSKVGKLLSEQLNKNLFDSDQELAKSGKSLEETVDIRKYRLDEALLLTDAALLKNTVIVPGAGFIENKDVINYLKQNGVFVYLDTPLDCLLERAKNNERPLLKSEQDVINLYNARKSVYEEIADIKIDTNNKTKEQLIQEMMVKLNEYYDHQWTKSISFRN